jgi:hypothetical protein
MRWNSAARSKLAARKRNENAFIKALTPNIEEKINLESAKPDKGNRPPPIRDTTKNEKSDQKRVREKQKGTK